LFASPHGIAPPRIALAVAAAFALAAAVISVRRPASDRKMTLDAIGESADKTGRLELGFGGGKNMAKGVG
jgi:hypothetical protein